MNRTVHLKGIVLVVAGVVAIGPDGLLIRLVAVDVWTLSLWRGLLLAGTLGGVQLVRHGGGTLAEFRRLGRRGLLAGCLSGVGTLLFVAAVTHTTVANVLIILGAAPLVAALLGRAFLGETVPRRTWLAIAAAAAGIWLAVGGGVAGPRPGDLFAFGTVLCLSGYLTVVRGAGDRDMTGCIVFSGLVVAALAAPFAAPLSVPAASVGYLLLLCVVVIPVSFSLITLGLRYLPAHEVALIGLLEAVLGPCLVWLVLDEHPGWHSIAGGAVVITVLAAHMLTGVRASAPAPVTPSPAAPPAPHRDDSTAGRRPAPPR